MEAQPHTPPDIDGINQSWLHVIDNLKQATLEMTELDDVTREKLESDFWPSHAALMAQLEKVTPGIANDILTRAEVIGTEKRAEELAAFEATTLPTAKRRAYMRGFMSVFNISGTSIKK
jgi:hypothetical protein